MSRHRTRQPRRAAALQTRPAPRRGWWALPVFLALTLAVKVIVAAQLGSHPLLQPDAGLDTQAYLRLAQRVSEGDLLLGPGLYYLSPLYLYFLAAAEAIAPSLGGVRALQAALGTAGVYCIFVAGRAWFGTRAGWCAAIAAALCGEFTFYEIVLLQSALDPFLTAAALACLALALTRGSPRWSLAAGAVLGLQSLNRPNVLIAAAALVLALAIARRRRVAGLVLAGVCAALAPVVLRNAIVSHQLALGSSQGGLNFYIGNSERATGQYVAIPGVRADIEGQSEDTKRVAEAATGRSMTDSEVSGYFTGLAMTWIRNNPGSAAGLFAKKLALTFSAQHQWLDYSYPYYAHDVDSLLRVLVVGPWLLIPLGIAGLTFGLRRGRDFAAWVVFVPAYAIAVAIFFVGERYRLPLFVPLCVGSGVAVDAALTRVMARDLRGLAPAAGAFAAAAILAWWPHHLDSGRFAERLRLSKVLMNRGDYGDAIEELRRAHEIDPSQTVTEFNLGMALVSSGQTAEGLGFVKHAVEAGVPVAGARYALASAMLRSGDRDEAAALLRTFQPAPSDSAESCVQVASLSVAAGAPDVAERFLRRAIALRPEWSLPREALERLRR